jgi:hypothetical protein
MTIKEADLEDCLFALLVVGLVVFLSVVYFHLFFV